MNSNKKIKFLLISGLILFVIVLNFNQTTNLHQFEFIFERKTFKYNIFFTETNVKRDFFSHKQMCSIESAAKNNPNSNVYIFSLNAKFHQTKLADVYKNIQLKLTTPEWIYKNTPLEDWWSSQKTNLLNGSFPIHDLSDTIRIALLYKYGGYYSDLDTITIRNIESLIGLNGLGYTTESRKPSIANGILIFEKNNTFLKEVIMNLKQTYRTDVWGHNGPRLFLRSLKKYCKTENVYTDLLFNKTLSKKCGVGLFPENYFYPVYWKKMSVLFEKNASFNVAMFFNAFSVHFYGKFSEKIPVKLNDYSIYEYFASLNCPYTYNNLKNDIIQNF